mmetsp:Transcript_2318/g.7432  ORF Transcript_2318/g.7432 Transcript_2318/m.7432 type:complete len:228 (-) Transcript_2318:618-1301(-)|eukprot:scaffold221318_cov37-Tisochrysis_lutea.AAC.3
MPVAEQGASRTMVRIEPCLAPQRVSHHALGVLASPHTISTPAMPLNSRCSAATFRGDFSTAIMRAPMGNRLMAARNLPPGAAHTSNIVWPGCTGESCEMHHCCAASCTNARRSFTPGRLVMFRGRERRVTPWGTKWMGVAGHFVENRSCAAYSSGAANRGVTHKCRRSGRLSNDGAKPASCWEPTLSRSFKYSHEGKEYADARLKDRRASERDARSTATITSLFNES